MPDAKVLVVDDTDHVRNMLVDMLELDGFTVVGQAASGADAVAMVDDANPDVIVMDYKMPGMDGLSAARAIRARRSSWLRPSTLPTVRATPASFASA